MNTINDDEHQAVMLAEVLEGLNIQPEGIYVDATFGRGGHTLAILEKLSTAGYLLVIDKDPEAIAVARTLSANDPRVHVHQGSFGNLRDICRQENLLGKVNGILLDLGVSSPQLNVASRGFSFRLEGPLDMRMDPSQGLSAAEWIKEASETDLVWVLKTYGEERFAKRIARAIVEARALSPITTTLQLAQIVSKANPAWEKHKHPATRCFQAIRIFINNELDDLVQALEAVVDVLTVGGRLAVLSFHSLEDRIVKRFIEKHEKGPEYPKGLPILASDIKHQLRRVNRRVKASVVEVQENVRSRSAILRLAERVGENR